MSIESADNILHVKNSTMRISRVEVGQTLSVGNIEFENTTTLTSVTSNGNNTTPYTVSLSNATTGLTTTANVVVGGELTVSGNATVTSNLEVGTANLYVDTTTGRVGVGTNTPMGTLDVKGVLNHTQVANVAQITSNSNVVMEYKLSTRDYETKEPRIALTANSDRGYVASASDTHDTVLTNNGGPWQAFDGTITQVTTEGWGSPNSRYSNDAAGSTAVNGVANSFNGRDGEWLNIKLPYKITLSSFETFVRIDRDHEHPTSGYLYASNDGFATFQEIYSFTDVAVPGEVNGKVTHTIPSSHLSVNLVAYNEYRLQATKLEGASGLVTIAEWKLYGTPFTANVATGTDVVLHTTPNVPKLDFSNVYYDGQDYTSMPATVTDKSGNGVTGTPSGGVGFDTTYKAFTFDGVDDQITATLTNPAGAWVHSTSMWWRQDSSPSTGWNYIYQIGAITTNAGALFAIHSDGYIAASSYASDQVKYDFVPVIGKWYHFSVVYRGGNYNKESIDIYVNGSNVGGYDNDTSNIPLSLGANTTLTLGAATGGTSLVHGSMANFRLYNQALSADEIWELYAYQKEYFGVSPDVVTLKAGRVGIGTSEPRAVLDVRGDIMSSSPVYFYLGIQDSHVAATTKIPFNRIRANKGGGYDTSTYNFTAPVGGWYWMAFGGVNRTTGVLHMSLKDGSNSTDTTLLMAYDNGYGNSLMQASRSGLVYIREGGIVSLWVTSSTVDSGNGFGGASVEWGGFLVSREFTGEN